VAKLFQDPTVGTYYTRRFEDGVVTRQIHPEGVVFLKRRGVQPGGDIPPFAMMELVRREWLYTKDDAVMHGEIDWSPDWHAIGDLPARRRERIRESTGWTRLGQAGDLAGGIVPTVTARQDGLRWSMLGMGTALILITVVAALMM
jgi:hypothetical protein